MLYQHTSHKNLNEVFAIT